MFFIPVIFCRFLWLWQAICETQQRCRDANSLKKKIVRFFWFFAEKFSNTKNLPTQKKWLGKWLRNGILWLSAVEASDRALTTAIWFEIPAPLVNIFSSFIVKLITYEYCIIVHNLINILRHFWSLNLDNFELIFVFVDFKEINWKWRYHWFSVLSSIQMVTADNPVQQHKTFTWKGWRKMKDKTIEKNNFNIESYRNRNISNRENCVKFDFLEKEIIKNSMIAERMSK